MTVVQHKVQLECDICRKRGTTPQQFSNGTHQGDLLLDNSQHLCYECLADFNKWVSKQRRKHEDK